MAWGNEGQRPITGGIQDAVPEDDPIPGAFIAMQTFGDFLGFNPHTHILVTDGCFYGGGGMFRVPPNATLPGDATKMWDDFSKERQLLHISYQIASPAPAF